MSKRILFFGNERLATGVTTDTPVLRGLLEAGYEIPAVVVAQANGGRSRRDRELEITKTADEYNLYAISPDSLIKAAAELASFDAEAAVLVAYGKLIPSTILNLFPKGIINIHPSLLPRYRGPTPIESTILNGDTETGVSLMKLSPKLDAGPIYIQHKLALGGNESKQALADRLALIGKDLLLDNLPAILDGALTPSEQAGFNYRIK